MCGIVAAVADRNIVSVLLEGLRKLEYRGYDSAGLALINGNGLHRLRAVGRVAEHHDGRPPCLDERHRVRRPRVREVATEPLVLDQIDLLRPVGGERRREFRGTAPEQAHTEFFVEPGGEPVRLAEHFERDGPQAAAVVLRDHPDAPALRLLGRLHFSRPASREPGPIGHTARPST